MSRKNLSAGVLPVLFMLIILSATTIFADSNSSNRPARPLDAVDTILSAFDRVPLVALGEGHALQTEHDFIQNLIRRPEFAARVKDIVIEFGSARYQNVIDRYVTGENVSFAELSQVWRNTPVSPFEQWDAPMYEKFFIMVREINASLPAAKKIRVWAAEPPIDWAVVSTRDEVFSWLLQREEYTASIVKNQVLARRRKALIIYGTSHLTRKSASVPGAPPAKNALQLIEEDYPNSTFIIIPHLGFNESNRDLEKRFDGWGKPSIALIKRTWLGRLDPQIVFKDIFIGAPGITPPNPWEGIKLEDLADAYLFMGRPDELTQAVPSPFIYRDDNYFNELNRRTIIITGAPIDEKEPQFYIFGIPKLPLPPL